MLKIEVDGKSYLNPNEELRNQMRDIVKEYDEKFENNQLLDENTIYAVIYDITTQLKEINPVEYISIVTLVYQDVFTYFKYMKKNNEIISYNKQNLVLLEANNMEEALEKYEENVDFFLENFVYLLRQNNLYLIRIRLSLEEKEHKKLRKICPLHQYDEYALQEYISFSSLEDYYLENLDEFSTPDELVDDIVFFFEYLYHNKKALYYIYINEIVKKLAKWCYYYLNQSSEVDEYDLEVRFVQLINGKKMSKIGNILSANPEFLKEILTRIFDDMDMGYPTIQTERGFEVPTDKVLNKYFEKWMDHKRN